MNKIVLTDYWVCGCPINPKAREVLHSFRTKLPDELYYKIDESLNGWDAELQIIIAVNIRDAVDYGWERYTNIVLLDEALKSFYLAIDKEMGRI